MEIRKFKFYFVIGSFCLLNWPTVAAASMTDLAKDLIGSMSGSYTIAVAPIDPKAARISAGVSQSLTERLTNAVQKQLSGTDHSLVERSRLRDIMKELEEFKGVEEFSKLVSSAGADVVIYPTVSRLNSNTVEFSARSVGISGDIAGKVLGSGDAIRIEVSTAFTVVVKGVMFRGEPKEQYNNALISGLSEAREFRVTTKKTTSAIDYIVVSEIDYSIDERDTKASRQAKQDKEGMKTFGKMFGLSQLTDQLAAQSNPDSLKTKSLTASVTTTLSGVVDGAIVTSELEEEKALDINSPDEDVSRMLKKIIKKLLRNTGEEVALKVTGGKTVRVKKKKGLLD
jgi:hypothetical protein